MIWREVPGGGRGGRKITPLIPMSDDEPQGSGELVPTEGDRFDMNHLAEQLVASAAQRGGSPNTLRSSMIPASCSGSPNESAPPRPAKATSDAPTAEAALVICVPGLGLDARAWERVRSGLTGDSRVLLLPSMGLPAARGTDLSVKGQTQRLLAAMPGCGAVILVGHSASSPVVVNAATRSDQVVGLVLIGSVTDPRAHTWPRMLSQWARTAIHERPPEARILFPQYLSTGPISMLRGMNAIRRFRTDLALNQLQLPVEILCGQNDRIAQPEWTSDLRHASSGQVTTIAGAAHMVPITDAGGLSSKR